MRLPYVLQALKASTAGRAPVQQGRVAAKCMAALLAAAPHFNYRSGKQAVLTAAGMTIKRPDHTACTFLSPCRSTSGACDLLAPQGRVHSVRVVTDALHLPQVGSLSAVALAKFWKACLLCRNIAQSGVAALLATSHGGGDAATEAVQVNYSAPCNAVLLIACFPL